jgi:molybdate transport system substrate-binding protein
MKPRSYKGPLCVAMLLLAAWFTVTVGAPPSTQAAHSGGKADPEAPKYHEQIFPPWQHGRNNDAIDKGFSFTIPEVDSMEDFHGDLNNHALVLYAGSNYCFAMAPPVQAFDLSAVR